MRGFCQPPSKLSRELCPSRPNRGNFVRKGMVLRGFCHRTWRPISLINSIISMNVLYKFIMHINNHNSFHLASCRPVKYRTHSYFSTVDLSSYRHCFFLNLYVVKNSPQTFSILARECMGIHKSFLFFWYSTFFLLVNRIVRKGICVFYHLSKQYDIKPFLWKRVKT